MYMPVWGSDTFSNVSELYHVDMASLSDNLLSRINHPIMSVEIASSRNLNIFSFSIVNQYVLKI